MKIVLPCKASGEPQPVYKWYVNGKEVNVNLGNIHMSPDPKDGSLTINPAVVLNEGFYQCKASNPYGLSMSNVARLQQAALLMIPSTDVRTYPVTEGESLQIQCNPPQSSVPKPSFSWATVKDTVDASPKKYETNKRVQMHMDGHLLFAYIEKEDDQNGKLFKCNAFNAYTDTLAGGSYSQIIVKPNANAPNKEPSIMYATPDGTVALLGGNLILKCFFGAKPAAKMSWKKLGANPAIAPGRYEFQEDETEVHIRDIRWDDEGSYECQGHNSQGSSKHHIYIQVHSVPSFIERPQNSNATEDDDKVFTCKADGVPPPNIQWYINGVPLDETNPGDRREISGDGTQLILRKLCKSCPDDSTDLMVVQCNASNPHGSVFSDGYLNVLERTNITTGPESLTIPVENATEATFYCEAASDDSTPIDIIWYLQRRRLYPDRDERLEVLPNNGLYINLTALDERGLAAYAGTYKCVATNGYSQDYATAVLTFPGVDPIEPKPIKAGFPIWLIILAILLAVLLFIIVILCCYCCNRPKEIIYDVDEKERAEGNDPVKELFVDGYMVFNRPEIGTLKRSRASIGSNLTLDRSRLNSTPDSLRGSTDHLTPL
jgi:receptor-type tyrosine-protein phosphatase zeta